MVAKKSLFDGWNALPNIVTYIRIVMMFAFMYFAILGGSLGSVNSVDRWIAGVLFIVAASTDKLDGYLARKYNQVTEMGKLMDPIADKLLICSALIIFSVFGEIWWWVTVLFVLREVGITVMRFLVIDHGGKVIAASAAGKLKTVTQCVGLGMLSLPMWTLLPGRFLNPIWVGYYWVSIGIILCALFFCLNSGVEYVLSVYGRKGPARTTPESTNDNKDNK